MIDDEFTNRVFFKQSCKLLGHACDVAVEGPPGIQMVLDRIKLIKKSEGAIVNYKIIFIDYNMPQMLGTKVACEISKMCTEFNVELPKMFCCSAEDDSPRFRQAVSDSGMKAALSKPI